MPPVKRSLILMLALLLSVAVVPANAEPPSDPIQQPQAQDRFVVFEAFMNPA